MKIIHLKPNFNRFRPDLTKWRSTKFLKTHRQSSARCSIIRPHLCWVRLKRWALRMELSIKAAGCFHLFTTSISSLWARLNEITSEMQASKRMAMLRSHFTNWTGATWIRPLLLGVSVRSWARAQIHHTQLELQEARVSASGKIIQTQLLIILQIDLWITIIQISSSTKVSANEHRSNKT